MALKGKEGRIGVRFWCTSCLLLIPYEGWEGPTPLGGEGVADASRP